MIMQGEPGCLSQMIAVYNETGGNVIAVSECDPAATASYGIVGVGAPAGSGGDAFRLTGMVEKPAPKDAPSNLYISGRYILQPQIFDLLAEHKRGAGNEIQLTDAMLTLAETQPFYGCRFHGRTHDCGAKLGFLVANIAYALEREDLADDLRKELARPARRLTAGRSGYFCRRSSTLQGIRLIGVAGDGAVFPFDGCSRR